MIKCLYTQRKMLGTSSASINSTEMDRKHKQFISGWKPNEKITMKLLLGIRDRLHGLKSFWLNFVSTFNRSNNIQL